ncbi:MAG: ribonuclease HII [bacterium]|nr:ribonuclease HII [bacterium]MDD5353968.1 ribonuclease HII [bacterium]MDD5756059.1 ribonuclease HII [bacterium]
MLKDEKKEKKRVSRLYVIEQQCYAAGAKLVAGVDESGRGPLAGPVVAGAVILPPFYYLAKLNDSKLVSEKDRNLLYQKIHNIAVAVGIGEASVELIDFHNILEATKLAMKKAIEDLGVTPDFLLIDAVKLADSTIKQKNIIKGDRISASIAAASIIAKVHRDKLMNELHKKYPRYGFDRHKGYGTKEHLAALSKYGPCPDHRKSFTPVKEVCHVQS